MAYPKPGACAGTVSSEEKPRLDRRRGADRPHQPPGGCGRRQCWASKVHETPVGFKYIGALMESEPIIVGGEESGGLSVKGHVPEKDGVLACLLMAELVAVERKPLGRILRELDKQAGEFHTERINVAIRPDTKDALLKKLGSGLSSIGSFKVQKFITTDGYKYLLPEGEWVAFRASGTEPLIRCYIEAKTENHLKKLREACRQLLK
jgi:phosphoglucomutase